MAQADKDSIDDKCRSILKELCDNRTLDSSEISQLLTDFRVLTREKTIDSSVLDERCIKILVDLAVKNHIEAQKSLSNLILNYVHLREGLIDPYVDCVDERLKNVVKRHSDGNGKQQSSETQQYCEVLYYDLRIIFLLSALCSRSRDNIRDRLLEPLLKVTLLEAEQFSEQNYLLVIESLKTLFNLTMDKCVDTKLAASVIKKLSSTLDSDEFKMLESKNELDSDHTDKLLVNLIHLLTNMPREVYLELSDQDVDKVLNHLDERLSNHSQASFRDTILPVLNACANICRHKEDVRIRWFDKIIGTTKDFDKRPEEYDTLRGRIVKLMTSVDVHIKEIAAEFLYALCGEDTEKFITYTGFGNSAAYLSTRGLLSTHNGGNANQSSNTEDAAYSEIRGKLDPITGKIEKQPKKSPMEGMSEEEKEWHAHQLADAISKLSNLGVIKPMQIGPDGQISDFASDNGKQERNSEGSGSSQD